MPEKTIGNKLFTKANLINAVVIVALLILVFVPSAKALLIHGLMSVGLCGRADVGYFHLEQGGEEGGKMQLPHKLALVFNKQIENQFHLWIPAFSALP